MAADEKTTITRAAGVTSSFTLLSRILGLVRDLVTAYLFGATPAADAFFVAFRLPNLVRRLSAEGAMSAAFVPIYTEVLVDQGPEPARRIAGAAASVLALILVAVSAAGIIFAPALVTVIAPGFGDDPAKFELTVLLTRIVFPFILFVSLATLLMGVLNSLGHFAAPAAAPIGLNLCIIGFALVLAPRLATPALALAMGAVIGGVVQLLMQLPPLIRRGAMPALIWAPGLAEVRRMGRRMVPVIFGSAAYQINLLINTLLASLLVSGSVSYLYYADRLVQFPLGVFGVALATAILPTLSRQAARGQKTEFAASTGHGLRLSLFIVLPSAIGLALLAQPIVSLIYQHGRFDAETTRLTVQALWAYSLGLPLAALATVAVRVFNALHDTRTPAIMGAVSVAANIVLSLILMGPLAHAGLALAASLGAAINLGLLLWFLFQKAPHLKEARLFAGLGRTVAASAGLAALLAGLYLHPASPPAHWPAWGQVASGLILGAGVYLGLARLFKCPELGALKEAFLKR